MSKLDSQLALREFLFNINQKDLIKAKYILTHITDLEKKERNQLLLALSKSEDKFAIKLLGYLMVKQPIIYNTYPTLRETLLAKISDNEDFFLQLLGTPSAEQSIYIQLSAEIGFQKAIPVLKEILAQHEDSFVIQKAVSALGQLASAEDLQILRQYLFSSKDELVKSCIYALGQNSTPKAFDMLFERLDNEREINELILDIFVQNQSQQSIQLLNKALQTGSTMLRNQVRNKMISLGSMAVEPLSRNLSIKDPDLQILSLEILGQINTPECVPPIRKLLYSHPFDANVRFSAYEALGALPMPKGAYILAQGLTDSNKQVRMAAIKAIDLHFNPQLATGLANITRTQDQEAYEVTKTILAGFADTIFLALLGEKNFWINAKHYLLTSAPPELLEHFHNLLLQTGHRDYALQLSTRKATETQKTKAYVVDDSPMVLNIYRSILYELQVEPVLFQSPYEALQSLQKEKPTIMFTDLNMPQMTGTELVGKVRELYSKDKLPIILVTSEQNTKNKEDAYLAGINALLSKPFTLQTMQSTLLSFL
jgi:CheY-like chemotaxis protein/HEAT repeat protein